MEKSQKLKQLTKHTIKKTQVLPEDCCTTHWGDPWCFKQQLPDLNNSRLY